MVRRTKNAPAAPVSTACYARLRVGLLLCCGAASSGREAIGTGVVAALGPIVAADGLALRQCADRAVCRAGASFRPAPDRSLSVGAVIRRVLRRCWTRSGIVRAGMTSWTRGPRCEARRSPAPRPRQRGEAVTARGRRGTGPEQEGLPCRMSCSWRDDAARRCSSRPRRRRARMM